MSWVNTNVLVTGAGGFVGSHLCDALADAGADVTALVRYNSRGSTGWLTPRDGIRIAHGDITDAPFMRDLLDTRNGWDCLFHLAAMISVPNSKAMRQSTIATNIMGTVNLFEAVLAREYFGNRIVMASSSEVYGNGPIPMRENTMRSPLSIYAASKIAADALGHAYHRMCGLDVVVVRPFNIYGPRQSTRAIIPHILCQLLDGKKTITVGNTDSLRDFTHVDDIVRGYMLAAQKGHIDGDEIILASGQMISVDDLALTCAHVLDIPDVTVISDPRRRRSTWDVTQLQGCASKAELLLGWKPTVSLCAGLKATAGWLRENRTLYKEADYV